MLISGWRGSHGSTTTPVVVLASASTSSRRIPRTIWGLTSLVDLRVILFGWTGSSIRFAFIWWGFVTILIVVTAAPWFIIIISIWRRTVTWVIEFYSWSGWVLVPIIIRFIGVIIILPGSLLLLIYLFVRFISCWRASLIKFSRITSMLFSLPENRMRCFAI